MKNLSPELLNITLIEMALQKGHTLNEHDLLELRTRVTAALAAKERHRQRMNASSFRWNKPKPPRSVI
ncbi:hypothetical protein PVM12_21365 [Enterobacter soli]|uniref:hypothetical protein n=1 Tax=Enterobacter soli TaxID=885040 RepID=UPI002378E507|nr:hypothetical protein [Enterobacter soli]MDD9246564.1 hypothetical protein [Enterobacter soli]